MDERKGVGDDADRFKFSNHLALLVSGALAFVVAFRLLAIANFSPTTAGAILTERGTTDVLVGTLLPSIATVLLMVGASLTIYGAATLPPKPGPLATTSAVLVTLAFLLAPWLITLLMVLWMVFLSLIAVVIVVVSSRRANVAEQGARETAGEAETRRQRLKRLRRRRTRKWLVRMMIVGYGLSVLLLLTATYPWMAAEKVATHDGKSYVGYVLRDAQGRFILMTEAERRVLIMRAGEIRQREICDPQSAVNRAFNGPPLLALLLGGDSPDYPPCS